MLLAIPTYSIPPQKKHLLHVVYCHGLRAFQTHGPLEDALKKMYGKSNVYYKRIQYGDGTVKGARSNLLYQIKDVHQQVIDDPVLYDKKNKKYTAPLLLIGQSMGATVAESYLKEYSDPKNPHILGLIKFVGTSSGYYGVPNRKIVTDVAKNWLDALLPNSSWATFKQVLTPILVGTVECCYPRAGCICYSDTLQKGTCCCLPCCPFPLGCILASIWNAPNKQNKYLDKSPLAKLNNEIKDHENFKKYKENMMAAKHLSIYSTDDPIAKPHESALRLTPKEIEAIKKKNMSLDFTRGAQYKENLLGLRTLYHKSKRDFNAIKNGEGKTIGLKNEGSHYSYAGFPHGHEGSWHAISLQIALEHIKKWVPKKHKRYNTILHTNKEPQAPSLNDLKSIISECQRKDKSLPFYVTKNKKITTKHGIILTESTIIPTTVKISLLEKDD